MPITNDISRWDYVGDDVTTAFQYDNLIFSASDLDVFLDGVLQGSGFTVSGIGATGGGNVTFTVAPAAGVVVVIVSNIPAHQPIDWIQNDDFPAETTETAMNRAMRVIQQLKTKLGRGLFLTDSDAQASIGDLPNLALRKGNFLFFNTATGEPEAASSIVGEVVSAFMKTVIDDVDAPTARATLEALKDVLTTRGDLVRAGVSGVEERLALGAAGQSLKSDGTDALWTDSVYDVAFNAGFGIDMTGVDLVVQTYAELVMTRSGSFTGEAGYIDTVATGAEAIVDIEKNGTTIYATKPQFAISSNTLTAGTLKTDGTEDFVSGDRITFKVTQIGSTIVGQKLRFTVKGATV